MTDTIEQAARVIRDAIGHFRASESMAEAAAQALSDAGLLASGEPVALDNWHEDDGNKLWWCFPVMEPPFAGTPNDDDWPGYHTHYTDIPLPTPPEGK